MSARQPRRSHQQWRSYIDKFRNQRKLSQQQFCQAEGLSLGTFRKHLYRAPAAVHVGHKAAPPKPTRSAADTGHFGPVTIRDTGVLTTGACLELPGNIRLHTQSLPSVEYLNNLVKVFGHGH